MEILYDDEDLGLLLLCSLPISFAKSLVTILWSHDELTVGKYMRPLVEGEHEKYGTITGIILQGRSSGVTW
jgi:hypothetical protein